MPPRPHLARIFPVSRQLMGTGPWRRALAACPPNAPPAEFPDLLARLADRGGLPPHIPDLARLEWTRRQVGAQEAPAALEAGPAILNPTLELVRCRWRHLPQLLASGSGGQEAVSAGEELVAVWQDPQGQTHLETATPGDLAALKVVVEGLAPEALAAESGNPAAAVLAALRQTARRGLILAPPSRLRRHPARLGPEPFRAAQSFSLQWHLTQVCDLHCRHCYDRTPRSTPSLAQGLEVLRQLQEFCRSRNVAGQVSFSGGNPFLHPHFFELYAAARDLGLGCAILGNPVSEDKLEQLMAIGAPLFYQVSLEGLQRHNDEIRGPGNFQRVLSFLGQLRRLEIPSVVMLTLTRTNLGQVLPLAESLRHLADSFTFNRLALFGEGARLELPVVGEYRGFLAAYLEAAGQNPIMRLKDSLFNILMEERGLEPFGGCTGFGCGAAFNFLTLLSDGEVHACRKFPSLIGNLKGSSLAELYDSETAAGFRRGSAACASCALHAVCGGCLAVTAGLGGDPFTSRDPFCFRAEGRIFHALGSGCFQPKEVRRHGT